MAPLLSEEEMALDPYTILGLTSDADEKAIKKSYRMLSLKYHPDKNSAPEAAVIFRQIQLSVELLNDVAKRAFLDGKLDQERKKKARYAEMDKKRKAMVDALVQREEDAKKAKVEQAKRHAQALEEESIKEAGRRMLEEAQKRQAELAAASARASGASNGSNGTNGNGHGHGHGHEKSSSSRERNGSGQPPITPLDLTLILQFPSSSTLAESSSSSSLQNTISSKYGPVSHVLLKEPPAPTEGKKKKKGKKAIVEFEKGNWGGCWACWNDHDEAATGVSEGQVQRGLEGVKAKWAAGSAPAWVEWASNQSKAPASDARSTPLPDSVPPDRTPTAPAPSLPSFTPTPSFGSAPSFGTTTMADLLSQHSRSRDDASDRKRNQQEYESLTLLKMRQMERERLAEQIRLEEGDD